MQRGSNPNIIALKQTIPTTSISPSLHLYFNGARVQKSYICVQSALNHLEVPGSTLLACIQRFAAHLSFSPRGVPQGSVQAPVNRLCVATLGICYRKLSVSILWTCASGCTAAIPLEIHLYSGFCGQPNNRR
jgi:hypothetical protein